MLVKIADIQVKNNRRIVDTAKVQELADSIKEIGLINPVTLDADNCLIAGAHRLEAFKLLKCVEIEAVIINLSGLHAELAEIDENLMRNELHYTIRGEQFSRRKEIYEELYPNTKANVAGGIVKHNPASEIISFAEDTAKKTGISRRTVEQEIQIAKKIIPEVKEVIKNNDLSKTDALKIARMNGTQQEKILSKIEKGITVEKAIIDIKREEKRQEIKVVPPKITNGKYDVIYADPPWQYEFAETENRAIENQYPTMKLDDIKALDIPCEDNSVLIMWATAPKLEEALSVLNAWGFSYKTCAVWDKEKIGMGYWFRGQHELLLIGVKGKFCAPKPEERVSSVYKEARTQHSKKPDYYYRLIEKMFPNGKYLELFARQKFSDKWEVWGNQIE